MKKEKIIIFLTGNKDRERGTKKTVFLFVREALPEVIAFFYHEDILKEHIKY